MSNVNCPVCGNTSLTKNLVKKAIIESYGSDKIIEIVEYSCSICGSEGDLFNENESILENAIVEVKKTVAMNILNDFSEKGYNFASLERVLEIPQRTFAKWKNNSVLPSAAGVTLLKFLRTFPWLLEVAENNFDFSIAQKIHLSTAFNQMISEMKFSNTSLKQAGLISSTDSSLMFFHFQKNGNIAETVASIEPQKQTIKWG